MQMKNYKNLIKVGAVTIGTSLLTLLYNFFNMYSLVGKCPDDIDVKPCQAYDNWAILNKVGLIVLAIGVVIFVIGLWRQRQNRP
jgi:hypothetical protein